MLALSRQLPKLQHQPSFKCRSIYGWSRIGNRDVVGHGPNGIACYKDDSHFPFPSVRFMENNPMVCMLRQREKCDWRMLCCEEKKALYRASFCQTFAEFQHPTGTWKAILGMVFFVTSIAFWMQVFNHAFIATPLPDSLDDEHQEAQLRRMLEIRTNPIDGISSKWDYANDRWKVPNSEEVWNEIRKGFLTRWNFPNCVGALDGKHINIKCPPGTGSDFFNYKSTFSIVLLACVDFDYCFTYIDIGAKGRHSDGGIFNYCTLKKAIEENTLHLPSDSVLVGDEAFPLKPYLMKPYPRRNNLTKEQKIYNYRLCRCRRIVENAFGILSARFRIFERPISTSPDKVDVIVKTTCALHNWLRKTSPSSYTPPGYIDEECPNSGIRLGTWRLTASSGAFGNISSQNNRNSTREAMRIRDDFCHYFNNDGAVSWQDNAILN